MDIYKLLEKKDFTYEDIKDIRKYHLDTYNEGIVISNYQEFINKIILITKLWPQEQNNKINYLFGSEIAIELALQGNVLNRRKNNHCYPLKKHGEIVLYDTKIIDLGDTKESANIKNAFGNIECYNYTNTKVLSGLEKELLDKNHDTVILNNEKILIPELEILFLDSYLQKELNHRKEGYDYELLLMEYELDTEKIINYLEEYYIKPKINNDKRYYELGMPYADTQWNLPENATVEEKAYADKGFSWQTRLWIDDMFMITIIQSQAYQVTGDEKYINRAAKEMVYYLDELQRPNGLFYHAPDVPFYWARGNGWMAAGMTELLKTLPRNNPDRKRILDGYLLMMRNLKNYQGKDGMWNQLVDDPDFWPETSGSAMFAYAIITGVKRGWLDQTEYAPVARKAWLALVPYIDENGDVREVCVGTNKKNDKQYYYDRPRITGDYHGQAPYLWCATALLE